MQQHHDHRRDSDRDDRETTCGARPRQTADRADAFMRRQSTWSSLLSIFRHQRPDEAQLTQVSTVAEVAIDQVFSAYHLTAAQQEARHGEVKDFAECAALYGYTLGRWQARQEIERELATGRMPLPAHLAGAGD